MISRLLTLCMVALLGFTAGSWTQEHYRGSVHVYHMMDVGTPLNHGQAVIDITLPSGVLFAGFGSCGPNIWHYKDKKLTWNELNVQIEKWDGEGFVKAEPVWREDLFQMNKPIDP